MGLIYQNENNANDIQNGNYIKISFVGEYTLKPLVLKYQSYFIRKNFNKDFNKCTEVDINPKDIEIFQTDLTKYTPNPLISNRDNFKIAVYNAVKFLLNKDKNNNTVELWKDYQPETIPIITPTEPIPSVTT